MSKTQRVLGWGALVMSLAVGGILAGCGTSEQQEEKIPVTSVQNEPNVQATTASIIKLGVAGAHSGDLASYGIPSMRAAELVVKAVNEKGGIDGRRVELLIEDDVCKPEVAANTATRMASNKVNVVLGHICSGATKAALGIYRDAGIITMSPSATNPDLTQSGEYPNFFRTIASDDAQARLEVDFALENLKLTQIAVLHDKGDYGKGLAEYAKAFIEQSGKAQVVLYEGVTPGAVDYSAIVQKIKRSEAQGVIFGGYHPEASKIVTQMRKKKMDIPFISDDGVKDDTFIKVAGEYAEDVYATGPRDVSGNRLAIQAKKEHQQAYNEDYGAFYLNAYSATMALLNAIDQADSIDPQAIDTALRTNWVETPLGMIRFDERGDAVGVGFSMYQVQNGRYIELE